MSKSLHFVVFLADWKCVLHPPSVLNTCFRYTFAVSIRLGLVLHRLKFICYNPDQKKNFAFESTLLAWLFMFWIDFCVILFIPILCIFLTLANNWSVVGFVKLYFSEGEYEMPVTPWRCIFLYTYCKIRHSGAWFFKYMHWPPSEYKGFLLCKWENLELNKFFSLEAYRPVVDWWIWTRGMGSWEFTMVIGLWH